LSAPIAEIGVFRGLIVPKPYVPHQTSRTYGTSLGCQLAHETIPIAENVPFVPHNKYPPLEITPFSRFGTWKTLYQKFKNLSLVNTCTHRFMTFISKMVKLVQDKCLKG